MLVLTRKKNESVMIGDVNKVEVIFLGFEGGKVRLGFRAPHEVPIYRSELTPLEVKKSIEEREQQIKKDNARKRKEEEVA